MTVYYMRSGTVAVNGQEVDIARLTNINLGGSDTDKEPIAIPSWMREGITIEVPMRIAFSGLPCTLTYADGRQVSGMSNFVTMRAYLEFPQFDQFALVDVVHQPTGDEPDRCGVELRHIVDNVEDARRWLMGDDHVPPTWKALLAAGEAM